LYKDNRIEGILKEIEDQWSRLEEAAEEKDTQWMVEESYELVDLLKLLIEIVEENE
jgi:hypothetical protein